MKRYLVSSFKDPDHINTFTFTEYDDLAQAIRAFVKNCVNYKPSVIYTFSKSWGQEEWTSEGVFHKNEYTKI